MKSVVDTVMFVDKENMQILTGYQKPAYQRRELIKQGIPFIKRHDGFPVVYTEDLKNGDASSSRINQHTEEPNYEGL